MLLCILLFFSLLMLVLMLMTHMHLQSKRGKQAQFQARVEMCQLLFKDTPKVVVSEVERNCFENAADGL